MSAAASTLSFPKLAAPEAWLSAAEAQRLTGWTARWLRQQVEQRSVRSRETSVKLPNGRFAREYLLSTLPAEARQRFAAEQSAAPAEPQQHELSLFAPRLIQAPRVATPRRNESAVDSRRRILQPLLDYQNQEHTRRIYASSLRTADGRPVDCFLRAIHWVIEQEASRGNVLTERTIRRWLAAHKLEGDAGLGRRRRTDKGQSRYFDDPAHHAAGVLVATLYLGDAFNQPLSVQQCYDMLLAQREAAGLAADDLPHYSTVRNFLTSAPRALQTYCRKGKRVFHEQHLPHIARSYGQPANAIWVSDTMIADVEVMNDCFTGAPLGAPVRLRLTAIIDFRSRYLVGYAWCWEGSSQSIASALRLAVQQHGPCAEWYCDNGKDFKKVARGAAHGFEREPVNEAWKEGEVQRIERTGLLARLGVRVTHCLPHHPQSKHIERFFRTVHLGFCKLWHTYTGGKPSERPEQTEALMALHRRSLKAGNLDRSQHPLATEFMQAFSTWVRIYHGKRHGGMGMKGRSPDEVFRVERTGKQRPAPRPEELAHLYWDETTALVNECQIRVNKIDYAARGVQQSRLLLDLNRTRVVVRYDPLDPAQVAVLDEDGHLLTMLEPKRLVAQDPSDPDVQRQIAEMQHTRGTLTRDMREARTAITRAAKRLGVQHPLQLLQANPDKPAAEALPAVLDSGPRPAPIVQRKPRFEPIAPHAAPAYAHNLVAQVLGRKEPK